jgi:hypothetical protein
VQQRNRLLPARLVVYFVLAMCLFSGQSYEEVVRLKLPVLRLGGAGVTGVGSDEVRVGGRLNGGLL